MQSTKPIRLALLWHMHQPDYRLHNHLLLPWTRLHAIKDYGEMLRILERHPAMKCTVNFVPSLLRQIAGYAEEGWTDEIRELTLCPAEELSARETERLLYWASLLPRPRLVSPWPGFERILDRGLKDPGMLTIDEVHDLQVWYMLAWTGEIGRDELDITLPETSATHFTDADRIAMCALHDRAVAELPPYLRSLSSSTSVELSTSPWYHPILPLLLDLDDAARSMPEADLPDTATGWTEDSGHQLMGARRTHQEWFGSPPEGCWPSEGSLSARTLDQLITTGFTWTASDEFLLYRTLGDESGSVDHCYPWKYEGNEGEITILFRDHNLSDRIGFVYGGMDEAEAVDDFVDGILDRRSRVIEAHGEDGLDDAVVVVVLDGENCWEWYRRNGKPFLDLLYARLVDHSLITPVTMSEAAEATSHERRLGDLVPGSWIGGDFRIWIGGSVDNRAWELLAEARSHLMNHRHRVTEERFFAAYEHLLAAEGSDWFWWYSSENSSVNDPDFDLIFRHRLQEIYRIIEMSPPAELDNPLDVTSTGAAERSGRVGPSTMHRAMFDEENQDPGTVR